MNKTYKLPDKITELTPYEPISGNYKIRLDANESFLSSDNGALANALANISLNRYPDPYSAKVTAAFSRFYGVNPEIVTAGNGSDELISLITGCFLNKGDKIPVLSHDFSMYYFYPPIYELDIRILEKEPNLEINADKIISYANENNVDCIMFSNPCNPTSLAAAKSEVLNIVKNVGALVILDEAYMDFWDESESLISETENFDNLIVLRTCSKAHGLAGIRLGFAVSNAKLTRALKSAKSPYNVNALTQEIGRIILSDAEKLRQNISAIKKSVNYLYKELTALNFPFFRKIFETKTNFLFIEAENAAAIHAFLLKESIAVRISGNHLRITCGTEAENRELLAALKKYNGIQS